MSLLKSDMSLQKSEMTVEWLSRVDLDAFVDFHLKCDPYSLKRRRRQRKNKATNLTRRVRDSLVRCRTYLTVPNRFVDSVHFRRILTNLFASTTSLPDLDVSLLLQTTSKTLLTLIRRWRLRLIPHLQ